MNSRQRLIEWLAADIDTGLSSKTMAFVHLGATKGRFDAPHDPADFGRCYDLVEFVPELHESFCLIGERCPQFKCIIECWYFLSELWVEESPSGRCPKLARKLDELRHPK